MKDNEMRQIMHMKCIMPAGRRFEVKIDNTEDK